MKDLLNIGNMMNCRSFRPHTHSAWEMIYYTRGNVRLTIDGKKHTLSPGTFVCQPPGLAHGEEGLAVFDNYFFSVAEYRVLPDRKIIVRDTVNEAIGNQIRQMHIAYMTKPVNYRTICEEHLRIIVQYTLSQLKENLAISPYVNRFACELASRASDCSFKISDLKKTVPFTFDHFRLLFKNAMGCTPIEYLNRIRISNAKELLDHQYYGSGLSVANIAMMSGYSDPLYFSRCFKKHTGMAPSEWIHREAL